MRAIPMQARGKTPAEGAFLETLSKGDVFFTRTDNSGCWASRAVDKTFRERLKRSLRFYARQLYRQVLQSAY